MSRDLRREVSLLLKKISPVDKERFSQAICEQLIRSFTIRKPASVALYAALPTEVSLDRLALWCTEQKIPTAYPRMDQAASSGMRFLEADPAHSYSWDNASFGFSQPKNGEPEWRPSSLLDVVVVPGLIFGESGKGIRDGYVRHQTSNGM